MTIGRPTRFICAGSNSESVVLQGVAAGAPLTVAIPRFNGCCELGGCFFPFSPFLYFFFRIREPWANLSLFELLTGMDCWPATVSSMLTAISMTEVISVPASLPHVLASRKKGDEFKPLYLAYSLALCVAALDAAPPRLLVTGVWESAQAESESAPPCAVPYFVFCCASCVWKMQNSAKAGQDGAKSSLFLLEVMMSTMQTSSELEILILCIEFRSACTDVHQQPQRITTLQCCRRVHLVCQTLSWSWITA